MKGLGQKGGKDQKVEGCHKKKKDIVILYIEPMFLTSTM